jgi:hypothetical protein
MKTYFQFIILSLFLLTACKDDFLVQEPHQINEVAFYTSEQGAAQGLNAAYSTLGLGQKLTDTEFLGDVCSGDAMAGGEPGGNDQLPMQQAMKFSRVTSSPYSQEYWQYNYIAIYRTNLLIKYLSEPIDGFDETKRKTILGEAYFLRALYHFKLQIFFGGMPQLQDDFGGQLKGVPYIDHVLSSDEWKTITRPTIEETWSKIESDFITASGLLPLRSAQSSDQLGHATKGAADAMLAKSYLYQEKWQQAFDAAETVINSNEYYLIGDNDHPGPFTITRSSKFGDVDVQVPGFKYIWQAEANNCAEEIFSVQHYPEATNKWPEGQQGSILGQHYGVRAVLIYDRNGNEVSAEYFWGFMLPTSYFVKTAFKDIECEPVEGDIRDPRFKLSVITPNDSVPFTYTNTDLRTKYPDSVMFNAWYNWPCTGYSTWKYFTDPYWYTNKNAHPQNTKFLRYADLLLIAAEAAVHIGDNDKALQYINLVRERARNSGNTTYPKAYTSVDLNKIYAERRVELAFEGHQFYDLVRTKRAAKVLKEDAMQYQYSTNPITNETAPQEFGDNYTVGRDEVNPIPEVEITLINNPGFTQNPGYTN